MDTAPVEPTSPPAPTEPGGWPAPFVARPRPAPAETHFQADVLKHVTDAIIALDLEGRVTYWNAGAERLHGLLAERVLGRLLSDCVQYAILPDPDEDLPATRVADARAAIRHAADGSGDLIYSAPDGQRRVVSVSTSVLLDDRGAEQGMLALVRDVSVQREMAAGLRHQALHDGLTGLPNRILFSARIERALERGAPCAVLFVDLDRFKGINDTLGHDTGDLLLTTIAERMLEVMDPSGVVARLGGDEFGVLVPGPPERALEVAEQLIERISTPVNVGPRTITPRASIGVVVHAERYADSMSPLRDADTAMYEAKRLGQGHVAVFDQAMHESAAFRFGLEHDLRHAIRADQMRLRFQPIIDLETGTVVGFEALVRWQHPELGLVEPSEFVPIAEEIGVVPDLDRWVLRQAIAELSAWPEAEAHHTVNVNCSVQGFLQDDFASHAAAAVREAELAPHRLIFELTERTFVDPVAAQATLNALHGHGLGLCIDDFGAGYSSLALLHTLTVDSLKIDRSFVADLADSHTARAVVRAVVQLSTDLNLKAVAEGIETPEQLATLRHIGCRYGQGFLFSKPVDATEARAMITAPPWRTSWRRWEQTPAP
jgi:diguanylate cyclase (GGDEF)-like protein/PAS domain S-box-containing protein